MKITEANKEDEAIFVRNDALPCRRFWCKLNPLKTFLKIFYLLPVILVMGVLGYIYWNHSHPPPERVVTGTPFATTKIGALTATLFTNGRELRAAGSDLFIEFHDATGKSVDVGDVTFELSVNIPDPVTHATDAVMHTIAHVFRTSTVGQYRAAVVPQVAGDWTAKITFSGPVGKADASFTLPVK